MDTKHTGLGSPCSPRWDDGWVAAVNAAEAKANRRICGARTCAGTPCTLEPNHENGRCRFHFNHCHGFSLGFAKFASLFCPADQGFAQKGDLVQAVFVFLVSFGHGYRLLLAVFNFFDFGY